MKINAIERISNHPIEGRFELDSVKPVARPLFTIGSTLEAAKLAEESSPPLFKPILRPPGVHFMIPILQVQLKMEQIARLEGEQLDGDVKESLHRLESLNKKRLVTLKLHAQEIGNKQTWGVWQAVSQYVSSATTIVFGVGCVGLGGAASVAGAFLVASGGLGMLNRVMSDTNGWSWMCGFFSASKELQLKNAQIIDTYSTYISMSLAVAGAIGAYQAGAFALLTTGGRDAAVAKTSAILTGAGTALGLIGRTGTAIADRSMYRIRADLKEMEIQTRVTEQEIAMDVSEIRKMIELSEAISEVVKRAIEASATV